MSAVRGLLRDLIERKLWPVAVLLLAAAIAVPMYLGRSSSEPGTPATSGNEQASTGKMSKAAVSIEDPAAGDDRRGSVRNPFKQLHVPKPAATPTSTPDSTSNSPSRGSTPSSGSGSGSGDSDSGGRAPARAARARGPAPAPAPAAAPTPTHSTPTT
jgi:hypothetical protein